ncbi:MAG: hypothetical protein KF832_21625 [Caldilineaceae bacterium]|nr:hypothetical protein [Caldilineaceae bacterium]
MRSRMIHFGLIPLLASCGVLLLFLLLGVGRHTPTAFAHFFTPTQTFRDVNGVRVWADTFLEASGQVTATGGVKLGPAQTEQQWFQISEHAVWLTDTTKMTLTGQLAMAGSRQLLQGKFPVNPATGSLTIPTDSLNLYQTLGDSSLAITPTYAINLRQSEIHAASKLDLRLPEGTLKADIQFQLGFNDQITGTATIPIDLQLAGGRLHGTANIRNDGLYVPSVRYEIENITTTLNDLIIDGKDDLKLRFGAGVDFPIPDLDLGDGFFVLTNLRGQLGIRLSNGNQPLGYEMGLTGKVRFDKLPENSAVTANAVNLKFADGALSGGVESFTVKYSGNEMSFRGVRFGSAAVNAATVAAGNGFQRVLFTEGADFTLPKEWRPTDEVIPTVRLQNVTIQSTAPFITIGGAGIGFVINKEYYLGGSAAAANRIKLSGIQGRVDYNFQSSRWSTSITATMGLQMGDGVATSVTGNLTTDSTGKFRGRVVNLTLDVAGVQMALNQLDFQADAFIAGSAILRLPQNFGNVTVNNIRIDATGVRISNGTFALPDVPFNTVRLTQNSGSFQVSGSQYSLAITSTIRIEGGATPLPGSGNSGVLVRGNLKIRNGRVTGTVDQFGFILSGAEFRLTNPTFLDNRLIASQAAMSIPTGGSMLTVSANGIEIGGPSGFKFRQPTIQLPDFTVAGVGIRRPRLEFEQRGNNFVLTGGAELQFTQFTVAGDFTITRRNNLLEFNPVQLDFRATPGIPLGQTGFELTRITGAFNLSSGTATFQLGVRIESQAKVILPIVAMDGTITLKVLPRFDLQATAGVQVVGLTVSTANLRITPTSATLSGRMEYQVARQIVNLSFGMDRNREFTMTGSMRGELGLRKGSLIHWCVPLAGCVDVPPSTMTLAAVTYDAGKFTDRRTSTRRTVWGGRAQFSILGNRAYAFLRLAPSPQEIIVGTTLDDYRPINPAISASEAAAPDAIHYIAADGLHHFDIANPAELLVFGEIITGTNLTAPAQPLIATSPTGETFTLQPIYTEADNRVRIYSLTYPTPAKAIGQWTVLVHPGNAVKMWGQQPGVQITRFDIRTAANQLIPLAGTGPTVVINNGETLALDLAVTKPAPGINVQLYAEDAQGARFALVEQLDENTTTLAINQPWTTNLPSGLYTLTLVADDFGSSMAISSTVPLQVNDSTPPAAPANLTAQVQVDGSVQLSWVAPTAPDLAGYQIGVVGESVLAIDGARTSYSMGGLAPGSTPTVQVQSYDSSGNVSSAATTSITLPTFRLESLSPAQDTQAAAVTVVAAAFNSAIQQATLTLVNSQQQPMLGTTTPVTIEQTLDVVEIIGTQLTLPTALSADHYTATLTVHPLDSAPFTWQWAFTIAAGEPTSNQPGDLFLPIIHR